MKKLRILGLLIVGALLFNSCEVLEPCEQDNYGSVTVNNLMGETYLFDVTYETDAAGEWLENKNISVSSSNSGTWEEVSSGNAAIWVISSITDEWFVAKTINVTNCEDLEITFSNQCELENAGTVTITNQTGYTMEFDVTYDGWTNLEVTIENGDSYTWTKLPVGSASVWINNNGWSVIETVSVSLCNDTPLNIEPQVEPCETNQTGSVTIYNNSGEYWDYGISSDGISVDYKRIYSGSSETWDEVDRGAAYIYYQDGITITEWTYLDAITVNTCDNTVFDHGGSSSDCETARTGEATVINNTGYTLIVDIENGNSNFTGERTVSNGESTTYTVNADNDISFWAKYESGGDWAESSDYDIDVCGTFEFTWNAGKMATLEGKAKPTTEKDKAIILEKLTAPEGARKLPVKVSR